MERNPSSPIDSNISMPWRNACSAASRSPARTSSQPLFKPRPPSHKFLAQVEEDLLPATLPLSTLVEQAEIGGARPLSDLGVRGDHPIVGQPYADLLTPLDPHLGPRHPELRPRRSARGPRTRAQRDHLPVRRGRRRARTRFLSPTRGTTSSPTSHSELHARARPSSSPSSCRTGIAALASSFELLRHPLRFHLPEEREVCQACSDRQAPIIERVGSLHGPPRAPTWLAPDLRR